MKSLAMKLDALSKIGVLRQYSLEDRLREYAQYPDEFRQDAINEATEYAAKGFICNEFVLNDGSVASVIQWQSPAQFIKNCYQWFVVLA
jgi:hypothetical protein